MTTLHLVPEALEQADDANTWWRTNRPDAQDLFESELRNAVHVLLEHPRIGRRFPLRKYPDARRYDLPRTRYAMYYRFSESDGTIAVVAVWHMGKGRGPF